GTRVGYYAQVQAPAGEQSPLEYIRSASPMVEERAIAMLRGKLILSYEQCHQPMRLLNGGHRSRLYLLGLALSGVNFLLLDEPTNNLDVPSMEALEEALADFPGSILAISHDRYFLDRIVTKILQFEAARVVCHLGNFTEAFQTS